MSVIPQSAPRWPLLVLVGLLCLVTPLSLAPTRALASTDLDVGGTALTLAATALRADPGYDAPVLLDVPAGTLVEVHDGPVWAADGSAWYAVGVWGNPGYLAADVLARSDGGMAVAEPAWTDSDVVGDDATAADAVGTDGMAADASMPPVATEDTSGAVPAPTAVDGAGGPATVAVGTGTITGTNGDGARCRVAADYGGAEITVLAEGTVVELTGWPVGEWQPVNCAGQAGYVYGAFVAMNAADATANAAAAPLDAAATGQPAPNAVAAVVSGYMVVSGTNGEGVRCRAWAGYDASIVTVLGEGTQVAVTGGAMGEWQPVMCAGVDGFVHGAFLSWSSGNAAPAPGGTATLPADTSGTAVTGSAMVSGTGGSGLRCRSGADYSAGVVTVLGEGTSVELRGGQMGEWQPVFCAGTSGYVHSSFLSWGSAPAANQGAAPTNQPAANPGVATGTMTVTGTGGAGVRCRSWAGYDASIFTVLGEGTVVSATGAASGEWQPVNCAGANGFVHVGFLTAGGTMGTAPAASAPPSAAPAAPAEGGGGLANGDHAATTADLNLRYDASYSAGVAAVAPAGTVVQITGGAVNGFHPVNWDGLYGYMFGGYLNWTDAALSVRGGSGTPTDGAAPAANTGSANGGAIVNFALQYQGYPYVWATAGPSSFDCSGFVYWVIKNVLGRDIGRGLETQIVAGTPVSYGNLQPGDIVFFQNTFQWGLSHDGIYIGNGQFIHAENPSTGVRISDLGSQYYSSRYYGAVRMV